MDETIDSRWWLVVGPNVWGRGATRDEAMKQAKKVNGRRGNRLGWYVYRYVEAQKACVDEYGRLTWWPRSEDDTERPECVERPKGAAK